MEDNNSKYEYGINISHQSDKSDDRFDALLKSMSKDFDTMMESRSANKDKYRDEYTKLHSQNNTIKDTTHQTFGSRFAEENNAFAKKVLNDFQKKDDLETRDSDEQIYNSYLNINKKSKTEKANLFEDYEEKDGIDEINTLYNDNYRADLYKSDNSKFDKDINKTQVYNTNFGTSYYSGSSYSPYATLPEKDLKHVSILGNSLNKTPDFNKYKNSKSIFNELDKTRDGSNYLFDIYSKKNTQNIKGHEPLLKKSKKSDEINYMDNYNNSSYKNYKKNYQPKDVYYPKTKYATTTEYSNIYDSRGYENYSEYNNINRAVSNQCKNCPSYKNHDYRYEDYNSDINEDYKMYQMQRYGQDRHNDLKKRYDSDYDRYYPKTAYQKNKFDNMHDSQMYDYNTRVDNTPQSLYKWDRRFIDMAYVISSWSSCINRSVGAVIVANNRVVATGYNGAPKGIRSCKEKNECMRKKMHIESGTRQELCYAVHAEQNAIVQAARMGTSIENATIYCTHQPCSICAKLIIASGIARVVYSEGYPDLFAIDLMREAGIELIRI